MNPDFYLSIILLTQRRQLNLIFSYATDNVNTINFSFFTVEPLLFIFWSDIFERQSTPKQGDCL